MSKKNILIIILLIIIISGVFIFWKYIKIPKKIIQKEEINTPDRELIKNYSSLKLASLTEENVKNLHNECFNLDNLEVKHFAYESLFFSENRNIIGVDGKKENSLSLLPKSITNPPSK